MTIDNLLIRKGAEIRIVQRDVKGQILWVLEDFGHSRLDGRKFGRVVAAVAEKVEKPRKDAVLDF